MVKKEEKVITLEPVEFKRGTESESFDEIRNINRQDYDITRRKVRIFCDTKIIHAAEYYTTMYNYVYLRSVFIISYMSDLRTPSIFLPNK